MESFQILITVSAIFTESGCAGNCCTTVKNETMTINLFIPGNEAISFAIRTRSINILNPEKIAGVANLSESEQILQD
jgi:hypothetical protein